MKECNVCKTVKSLGEFQKKAGNPDGHTYMCKLCKRAYDNAHYRKNPNRRTYIKNNSKGRVNKVQLEVLEYLKLHPCIDCGNSDVRVLEFDHRSDKITEVSRMMQMNSRDKVFKEIEKCDVRCANCHRIKTSESLGWWKSILS